MESIEELKIDRYLHWYKALSIEKTKRGLLKRYKAVCRYLETRFKGRSSLPKEYSLIQGFIDGLNPNKQPISNNISFRWYEHFKSKAEILNKEITATQDERGIDLLFSLTNSKDYYIPSLDEWETFEADRVLCFESITKSFEKSLTRVLNFDEFANRELNKTHQYIKESSFYDYTVSGFPIKSAGNSWTSFTEWVYNIDFANWLTSKITAKPANNSSLSFEKTKRGVVLYYYYLSESGGPSLYESETLSQAGKIFGFKKEAIQRERNAFKPIEITIVDKKKPMVKKWILNDIRFAYYTLKEETNNKTAIAKALEHLKIIEEKTKA